jgi:uncharacterized protein (UPF0147 family)
LDDFDISGEQIVNGNAEHIHRFLEILYEYSKIYMDSRKPTNIIKTAPVKNRILKEKDSNPVYRNSARESRRVQQDKEE